MSHLVCPLCGKNAPLSTFNPESLDLDLKLVSFKGLGRGKGFMVSEEFSVLDEPYLSGIVSERVLALCKIFFDRGVIDATSLMHKLNMQTQPVTSSKDRQIEQLSRDLKRARSSESKTIRRLSDLQIKYDRVVDSLRKTQGELDELKAAQENINDDLDEIIEAIEEEVGKEVYEEGNETSARELVPGIDKSWKLKLMEVDPGCLDALNTIAQKMGPENKKFLSKRIVGDTPHIEKILKDLKIK